MVYGSGVDVSRPHLRSGLCVTATEKTLGCGLSHADRSHTVSVREVAVTSNIHS